MTFQFAVPVIDAIAGSIEAVETAGAAWQTLPGPHGWVPVAAAVGAAAVARWLWFGQGDQQARFEAIRRRHDELAMITAKLHEASRLVRLFNGTSVQYRTLNRHLEDVMGAADRLGSQLARAEQEIAGWHFHKARRALGLLERNLKDLERELKAVQDSLKGLTDDNRECERCLEAVRARRLELLRAASRPDVGWAQDLVGELHELEGAIARTEALHASGDLVLALQHCREVTTTLQAHRKRLDSRAMSLRWLRGVPEQARRLQHERERLEATGFRGLPEVDQESLKHRSQAAIDRLFAGDLEAASTIQQELRQALEGLRRGLSGREELWWGNERALRALKSELQTMEVQLAAIRPAGIVDRYPARLWRPAERQEGDVRKLLARLWEALMAAEADNALATQRFETARDRLRQAAALRDVVREELNRTTELWQVPVREEARLSARLLGLLGEAAEAHARARLLGMSQEPQIEALLFAARSALDAERPALDEAARTLECAADALARYRTRLTDLQTRLEPSARRPIIFLRQDADVPEDAPRRSR